MKKSIVPRIIILLIICNLTYAQEKVAFIDIDYLFLNSTEGKKIIKSLNEINKENLEEISNNESKILDLKKEIDLKKNILSQNEIQKMIESLNQLVLNTRQNRDNLLMNFEKKKNKEIELFFINIKPLIEDYMNKNEINVIFDKKNIFIANEKNDITQDILKLIIN